MGTRRHSRCVDGVYVCEMEDKNVRGVPVRLVRGMVLVMPVQLEPPQPFCAAGHPISASYGKS